MINLSPQPLIPSICPFHSRPPMDGFSECDKGFHPITTPSPLRNDEDFYRCWPFSRDFTIFRSSNESFASNHYPICCQLFAKIYFWLAYSSGNTSQQSEPRKIEKLSIFLCLRLSLILVLYLIFRNYLQIFHNFLIFGSNFV